MDKMEQRNSRKNGLIFFITIPLIIILIIMNIYFFKNVSDLKNTIKTNTNLKEKKEIEYNNNLAEIEKTEEEISKIKNIDNEIINAKNQYYQTLKTFEDKVANNEVDYKIAYLTFDDGPYNLTHQFLEILQNYDVRATFFTIGYNKEPCFDDRSKSCADLYAKEASLGHTMANHTYSHLIFYGLYSSTESFMSQVKKQEQLIKEKTGLTTNIVRFPGGISTSKHLKNSIIEQLRNNGYGWVDWTASNGDGGYVPNKETAINNLKKTINEDIEVVLFHDYNYITLSALPEVIEYLRSENYVLLPLFYESRMVNK